MADYHLLDSRKGKAIWTGSSWPDAKRAHERARKKLSVKLICMWPCGCIRQRVITRVVSIYPDIEHPVFGWRRIEACAQHARRKGRREL